MSPHIDREGKYVPTPPDHSTEHVIYRSVFSRRQKKNLIETEMMDLSFQKRIKGKKMIFLKWTLKTHRTILIFERW